MKVIVNQDTCIGCGACAAIAEDIFEINNDGLSTAKVEEVPADKEAETREAIESCPVAAIVEE